MICTKLTRSVFLALTLLFASAACAQELVAVAGQTEPTAAAPRTGSSPAPKGTVSTSSEARRLAVGEALVTL